MPILEIDIPQNKKRFTFLEKVIILHKKVMTRHEIVMSRYKLVITRYKLVMILHKKVITAPKKGITRHPIVSLAWGRHKTPQPTAVKHGEA